MIAAITGASGHLGNCLCKRLLQDGVQIKALLHNHPDDLENHGIELIRGDVRDRNAVAKLVEGADVVFHLAARIAINNRKRKEVYDVNVNGTRKVVEACLEKKVKRLVHVSSIHTLLMQDVNEKIDGSGPLITDRRIAYEHSKAEGERIVHDAVKNGLDAVILTPTAIVGPYDYTHSFLGQALIRIYRNQIPMLIQGGYDFVDVRDVADGAIKAATKGRRGARYILSGKWYSLGELSRMIGEISGRKTPNWIAPPVVAQVGLPFIQAFSALTRQEPLYTRQSLYILKHSGRNISSERAKEDFGYSPRPFSETLKDTFDWYKQNGML